MNQGQTHIKRSLYNVGYESEGGILNVTIYLFNKS